MSHTIQDEFIELLGKKILDTILELIQVDRYYSIILDCTPDVNHKEQMTMIICHVHATDDGIIIYEHFVGFLQVNKSTGSNLVSVSLKRLDELGLDIMNCKGQGYENGANMAGRHSGVQSRVLQINPQARFVPCSSHSLDLILCDCAKTNVTFFSFFGTFQKLYSKLSSSTQRWKVLKDNWMNWALIFGCEVSIRNTIRESRQFCKSGLFTFGWCSQNCAIDFTKCI